MPPETPRPDPADFPVLTAMPEAAEILTRLDALSKAARDLAAGLGKQNEALRIFDERLGAIEADLSRLAKMADDASVFLDSPVAKFLASRRKLTVAGADGPPA